MVLLSIFGCVSGGTCSLLLLCWIYDAEGRSKHLCVVTTD